MKKPLFHTHPRRCDSTTRSSRQWHHVVKYVHWKVKFKRVKFINFIAYLDYLKVSFRASFSFLTDRLSYLLTNWLRQVAFPVSLGLTISYKKAQLSLTNPRDANVCQKLLQFDVLTTLSLTILAYLHSFSCCCVRNLRNPAKFTKNSNLWSLRSSKVIDLGVNRKPICDLLHISH